MRELAFTIEEGRAALAAAQGNYSAAARALGVGERNFHLRMRAAPPAELLDSPLIPPNAIRKFGIVDGTVLVGSDYHRWPGLPRSTAFAALCRMTCDLQPKAVIIAGDVIDGARVSRHARIGWNHQPHLAGEIGAAQEDLADLATVSDADRFWPLGNHDGRLETYLANAASEVSGLLGMSLRDHFPDWAPCWAVDIDGQVIVRHKPQKANPTQNTLWAGRTTVHGHDHRLGVVAFADYNGTRWNVDSGTLAVPYGPQFGDYTEYSPVNWGSGFAVLTFHDGQLLWPELVHVVNEAQRLTSFRGQVVQELEG